MRRVAKRSALALVAVGLAAVACSKSAAERPVATVTYSARLPRPDSTATSARTLDSTGYVDNAGRTSEETVRTQMSGMRATETGSERPTGTPGSGTPIVPVRPRPRPSRVENAGELGGEQGSGTGIPGDTVVGRIARARCDREIACDRVGTGKTFGTSEQCMSSLRERAREDVVAAGCIRGFEATQLAICLNTIRQLACETPMDDVTMVSVGNCEAATLCTALPSP